MEKSKASYPWWSTQNSPNQSQWLQLTLTESEERTKEMLELLQDEGDTFAQRAEMYYKKKPELVRMVEELHRSFRALAERFDSFRSDSIRVTRLGSSSSSSNSFGSSGQTKLETPNLHPKSILEDPDPDPDPEGNTTSKFDVEYINNIPHDVNSPETSRLNNMIEINIENEQKEAKVKVNELDLGLDSNEELISEGKEITGLETSELLPMLTLGKEKRSPDVKLQISRLVEDNLRQQDELIKRNAEKREAIKDLCIQLQKLRDENMILKNRLRSSSSMKVSSKKRSQSSMTKFKELVLGKLFRKSSYLRDNNNTP